MRTVRSLIGSADPAKAVAVPAPPLSAAELIARAEALPDSAPVVRGPARPTRRRVLIGAGVAAGVAIAAAVSPALFGDPDSPGPSNPAPNAQYGLVPIVYEVDEDPPPAADYLRDLAGSLVDAPYEHHEGAYAYHHFRVYGNQTIFSPDGHVMGLVVEHETWIGTDGEGLRRQTTVDVVFANQESRDYFVTPDGYPFSLIGDTHDVPLSGPMEPLPTDPAGLADVLDVQSGAWTAAGAVLDTYTRYVVPTGTRAAILTVLADVPGFEWRGAVTDRAGRAGLAVTVGNPETGEEILLIFDPNTGALLARELITTETIATTVQRQVSYYHLLIDTDRRSQLG